MLKRLAIVASLIIILTPLGAYLSWPLWSASSARLLLRGQGIELQQADISRPSLHGINISNLEVDYKLSGYRLHLQAAELLISYQLRELFKGQLRQVHLPRLQLSLAASAADSARPGNSATSLAMLLPQSWLALAPLQQLQIDSLQITAPELAPQHTLTGQLHFSPAQLDLRLEIKQWPSQQLSPQLQPSQLQPSQLQPSQLQPSQPHPSQLEQPDSAKLVDGQLTLSADRHNALAASLILAGEPALQLSSRVSGTANKRVWDGELDLSLDSASGLLQRLGLLLPQQSLSGQLQSSWAMPLPEVLADDVLAHLQLNGHLRSSGEFTTFQPAFLAPATPEPTSTRPTTINPVPTNPASTNPALTYPALAGSFNLGASYHANQQQLRLQLGEAQISATPSVPMALLAPAGSPIAQELILALQLQPGASLQLQWEAGTLELENLAGQLRAEQADSGLAVLLDIDAASLSAPWATPDKAIATATLALHGELGRITSAGVSAEKIRLDSRGTLTLDSNRFDYTTSAATTLAASNIRSATLQAPLLKLALQAPLTLHWQEDNLTVPLAQLELGKHQLQLAGEQINLAAATLAVHNLSLPTAADKFPRTELALELRELIVQHQGLQLAPVNASAQLGLENNRLAGNFSANTSNNLLLSSGKFFHDLNSGSGRLDAKASSARFSEKQVFLPQLVKPLKLPLDLSAGQITAATRLNWKQQGLTASTAEIQLQNLGGFYQQHVVRGLNASLLADNLHGQWQLSSDSLQIAEINVGVPINNIQLGFISRAQTVRVRNLIAELLGGSISQNEIVYDWSAPHNALVINVQDIQLDQILKLESGVSGSGSLSGSLPLVITGTSARIDQGKLSSQAPGGVIKYDSKIPLGNSALDANLQLTLNALKNFHYQVLMVQVDADEAGDLVLAASLQGNNPDLKQQRPIHFNLNITENIPALLKSLKLTRDISDDLNRRIETLYQPRHQGAQ